MLTSLCYDIENNGGISMKNILLKTSAATLALICVSSAAFAVNNGLDTISGDFPISAAGVYAAIVGGGDNVAAGDFYFFNHVGIGITHPRATLEVNGSLKVGSTTVACSGTVEGTQRYNSTIHNFEFCDGTGWRTLGGVPRGTMCGFRLVGGFMGGDFVVPCQGVPSPYYGLACPSGYTVRGGFVMTNGGSSPGSVSLYSCIKD